MYYGSNKEWFIGGRARIEAGKASGWMRVASTSLTPATRSPRRGRWAHHRMVVRAGLTCRR
jgi:hypothetical protein